MTLSLAPNSAVGCDACREFLRVGLSGRGEPLVHAAVRARAAQRLEEHEVLLTFEAALRANDHEREPLLALRGTLERDRRR